MVETPKWYGNLLNSSYRILKHETLKDVGWYITLPIFTSSIQGGIHTNTITKILEHDVSSSCLPKHACYEST